MKHVDFNASNLAYNDTLATKNPVFNPALYELAGGKIETFDPAYESRERARQRQKARQRDLELAAKRRTIRKQKMKQQRMCGLLLAVLALSFIVTGLVIHDSDIVTAGVFVGFFSLGPLFSKQLFMFL